MDLNKKGIQTKKGEKWNNVSFQLTTRLFLLFKTYRNIKGGIIKTNDCLMRIKIVNKVNQMKKLDL